MSLKISVLIAVLLFATNSQETSWEENSYLAYTEKIINLADSSNEFCFNLLETIPENENVFLSPAGIYATVGMIYVGARTFTREIIRKVLKFNDSHILSDPDIHDWCGDFIRLLHNGSEEYSLEMANAFLYNKRFTIKSMFGNKLKNNYEALLKEIDPEGNMPASIAEINNWVSQKTHQKILEFIKELSNPDVVMTLLNAVYFRGYWTMPFAPEATADATFYNDGINEVSVPMMTLVERVPYGQFREFGLDAVELAYKGEHISMLILLPTSHDKLSEIERSLNTEKLDYIVSNLSLSLLEVMVHLPKFKLEESRVLNYNLKNMGLESLFGREARFSGFSGRRMRVSDVLHKAVIEVYEKGSEAATVTGIFTVPESRVEIFNVNHPFLFFIRDRRTNLILLAGRINRL